MKNLLNLFNLFIEKKFKKLDKRISSVERFSSISRNAAVDHLLGVPPRFFPSQLTKHAVCILNIPTV